MTFKLLRAIVNKRPIQEGFAEDVQARFMPHLKDASETEQLEAVKKNGLAIFNIPKPSLAVQLAAINNKPTAIMAIKDGVHFDYEAIKLAVSKNGYTIESLPDQSAELQMIAVQDAPDAITRISKPTNDAINTSLTSPTHFLHQQRYDNFVWIVNKLFPTNELMRNKWLRYGKKRWETRYDE